MVSVLSKEYEHVTTNFSPPESRDGLRSFKRALRPFMNERDLSVLDRE